MEFPQPERDGEIYSDAVKGRKVEGEQLGLQPRALTGWSTKAQGSRVFVPRCQSLADNLGKKYEDLPPGGLPCTYRDFLSFCSYSLERIKAQSNEHDINTQPGLTR